MIKIFETGDLHFGRKYDRYPEAKNKLTESRFQCLERMVRVAEREGCGIFAVTGDTFDNVTNIKVGDVKRVVEILAKFSGSVIVLPGNHDFYTDETKLWRDFRKAMASVDHNITIADSFAPIEMEVGDETVVIYPACCHEKHSMRNNLDWIRNSSIDADKYSVGLAHGAIAGITPDQNGEYFRMTEVELSAIPVDVWLIGHTHIPYPIREPADAVSGYRILNAGTPEQLDLGNHTVGLGYVVMLEKKNGKTGVTVKAIQTGAVNYIDESVKLEPGGNALEEQLISIAERCDGGTIVRLTLSGVLQAEEYKNRKRLYDNYLSGLLAYEVVDEELSVRMTEEEIRAEFPEFGFAAQVLRQLLDDPVESRMAYGLLKECRE